MERCEGSVKAHSGHQSTGGGSIPAPSLHYWFGETEEAQWLVEKFHYSKRWPSNVQFIVTAHLDGGLFGNKGEAVGAVVYSIPPTRWSVPVLELSRLVRADSARFQLSALVGMSVRRLRRSGDVNILVSFADWTQGHHGGIYQACGWKYNGQRDRAMDGLVIDGEFVPGRGANNRFGTRSPALLKERGIEAEPHWDEGKHLYWLAWGEGLKTAADVGLKSVPYPKPGEKTRASASASDVRQQSGDFGRVAGVAGERLDPEVQNGIAQARTWPRSKPWEATQGQLASGVAGVRYNPTLQSEARNLGGRYEVGPKFFALDTEGRKHVLHHELGHDLSDQMLRDGSAWKALDNGKLPQDLNGQTTPGRDRSRGVRVAAYGSAVLGVSRPRSRADHRGAS